jgi:hypothetical protein
MTMLSLSGIPRCVCTWLAVCGRAGWRMLSLHPVCPVHGGSR